MSLQPGVSILIEPATRLLGQITVPGDKSVSHRYAILAALAEGDSCVSGYGPGADCASTLACLRQLRADARFDARGTLHVPGRGLRGLSAPHAALDAGNSGTTLRLLAGVVAAHPFVATLTGDASLRRRPMRRVIVPLERMGARIETVENRPPLTVHGGDLRGIDVTPEVPSAQVKSAILLAGLQATGTTLVREPASTRDHTELALEAFGVRVTRQGTAIGVQGLQRMSGRNVTVPGDLSSAAFWAVAAAALPGSELIVEGVGLNATRTAVLGVLARAGARVEQTVTDIRHGEPVGRIVVRHERLESFVVTPAEVPLLIDELPALAALAAFGGGMQVTGAAELRAKESDRITALVTGLTALGAAAVELPDGFRLDPGARLTGGRADACGDHRLAMAFAIAALGATGPSEILGAGSVDVSYPGFFDVLRSLRA